MDTPLISIIIPFCNRDYIYMFHSIPTLINNFNCCEYEVIFVDDRENKSIDIFSNFNCNHSYKLITNKECIGAFESRRVGLNEATGKYIWFVDVDDSFDNFSSDKIATLEESNDIEIFTEKIFSKNPLIIQYCLYYTLFLSSFIKKVYDTIPITNHFSIGEDYSLLLVCTNYVKKIKVNFPMPYKFNMSQLKTLFPGAFIWLFSTESKEFLEKYYNKQINYQYNMLDCIFESNGEIKRLVHEIQRLQLTKAQMYDYVNITYKEYSYNNQKDCLDYIYSKGYLPN